MTCRVTPYIKSRTRHPSRWFQYNHLPGNALSPCFGKNTCPPEPMIRSVILAITNTMHGGRIEKTYCKLIASFRVNIRYRLWNSARLNCFLSAFVLWKPWMFEGWPSLVTGIHAEHSTHTLSQPPWRWNHSLIRVQQWWKSAEAAFDA